MAEAIQQDRKLNSQYGAKGDANRDLEGGAEE